MDDLQHLQARLAQVLSPKEWQATQSDDDRKEQTSGAPARVFSVFEIVDNILLHVVTVDQMYDIKMVRSRANEIGALYRLQRVNTTSRNVISCSKKLRAEMFLQLELDCDDNGKHNNGQENCPASSYEQVGKVPELPRQVNPLAACLHELLHLNGPWLLYREEDILIDGKLELKILNKDLIDYVSDCASWRKMLFANKPVCYRIRIHAVNWTATTSGKRARPRLMDVNLHEGATLGELADIVKVLINAHDERE